MATRLKNVPPEKIHKNPANPRLYFREPGMTKLADSIEEAGGVLVPVYVYPDARREGQYRLIDGERRWQTALKLGLKSIPCIVRDRAPDAGENIVEMFNIHQVREGWEDMPTARALLEVIKRKGTDDPNELKQLTGLSKEQIARYKLILDLPARYQKMIEDQKVPMNFFVELERNVIRPLARSRPRLAKEFSAAKLRGAFLKKRDRGKLEDLIELRDVKPIIERAAEDAGEREAPSALDDSLRTLFTKPEASIKEVYDASVAFAVESDKLAEQAAQIPRAFARLLEKAQSDAERTTILTNMRATRDALNALIEENQ